MQKIKSIHIILITAIILRLILAFGYEATGDTGGWILGGRTGLEKKQFGLGDGTVYDGKCTSLCVNWPPFTYHYMIAIRWSYLHLNWFNLPEYGFYKLISVLSDVGIIYLLHIIVYKKSKYYLVFPALYAFHPISLYISGFHGQRDSVWLFGLLLSTYFLNKNKIILSAIVFALAVSVKIPVILYLPYLLLSINEFINRVKHSLILIMTFILLGLPELITYPKYIIDNVVGYKGLFGFWGISGIIAKIGNVLGINNSAEIAYNYQKYLMFATVAILSLLLARKKIERFKSLLILNLVILALMPSYATQYFIWPLPFIILYANEYPKLLFLYTLFCVILLLNTYTAFSFPIGALYISQINVIMQNLIYYKISGFVYPLDLSWPIWLLILYFLRKIILRELTKKNK